MSACEEVLLPNARGAGFETLVLVGYLGVRGGRAPAGGGATEGRIFPDKLTLFTVRGFAVFYLALALSAIPLIFSKGMAPIRHYIWAGQVLIVTITAAAFVNLSHFDFATRSGGMVYFAAYLLAFVGGGLILAFAGRGPGVVR